jgi:hypothetical protein
MSISNPIADLKFRPATNAVVNRYDPPIRILDMSRARIQFEVVSRAKASADHPAGSGNPAGPPENGAASI